MVYVMKVSDLYSAITNTCLLYKIIKSDNSYEMYKNLPDDVLNLSVKYLYFHSNGIVNILDIKVGDK